MHHHTLDLLTRKGVAIITVPDEPSTAFIPASDAPSQPLSNDRAILVSDTVPDAEKDGKCPKCNESGLLWTPCATNQCVEEGVSFLPSVDFNYESIVGNCLACNDLGPSGDPCVHCDKEGETYLNFLARL